MEKLLSYAKDTKAIYNGTVEADKTKNGNIADNMELIDNAYYYVYFVLDNENGKYYPVEDVNIVQANIDSVRAKKWFATDIHWTKDEDIKKPEEPAKQEQPKVEDTTQAKGQLPKTGIICVELVAVILFILSTIIFALKYKKYKEI